MISFKYSSTFTQLFISFWLLFFISPGETAGSSEYSGYKVGSNTSSGVYDSSDFRSQLFSPATSYFLPRQKNDVSFTIPHWNPAVQFDSRDYFWTHEAATNSFPSLPFDAFVCEYHIGHRDGDLQRVKFSNGSRATGLFFGCDTKRAKCCGMYCCHSDTYLGAAAVFVFFFVFCPVIGFLCCVITAFCECFQIQCCCCTSASRSWCWSCCDKDTASGCAFCGDCCSDCCFEGLREFGSLCAGVDCSCDCNC